MKVVIHEAAAGDLHDIFGWISKDNPCSAWPLPRFERFKTAAKAPR
jgi:hypothetical protein